MDANDPLIPAPVTSWLRQPRDGEDPIEVLVESVIDHLNLNAIVWPAWDSEGGVSVPPPEHVLDSIVRSNDLVAEEEIAVRPAANTVVVVTELPSCDICHDPVARYDCRVSVAGATAAAFACTACFARYGSRALGATGDAYMMLSEEVPREVREVCNALASRLAKQPIFERPVNDPQL